MEDGTTTRLGDVIQIDQKPIEAHLSEIVRGSVEETLNAMLDAEAQQLCGAERYERTEERKRYRSGHYDRKLQTKAGEVTLRVDAAGFGRAGGSLQEGDGI